MKQTTVCLKCKTVVTNIGRHLRRGRCNAQHHRGGHYPSGVKGTGGLS